MFKTRSSWDPVFQRLEQDAAPFAVCTVFNGGKNERSWCQSQGCEAGTQKRGRHHCVRLQASPRSPVTVTDRLQGAIAGEMPLGSPSTLCAGGRGIP